MKAAWIFPIEKKCGISFYSHYYVDSLKKHVSIECFDPQQITKKGWEIIHRINEADIIHIQYERSLFEDGRKNFFALLCKKLCKPIVVTLHEVYKEFPDVYPRSKIKGKGIIFLLKRILYDLRHPSICAFESHLKKNFFATAILVHFRYHKEILMSLGLKNDLIHHLSHPIRIQKKPRPTPSFHELPIRLVSTGFINPAFDYDLLFSVLEQLGLPWRFTWIGGIRRFQDQSLLQAITSRVKSLGWENNFVISGWVSDETRDRMLEEAHLYCAFFKYRSSSESLATAFGAHKIVVATSIPMTQEIAEDWGSLYLAVSEPAQLCAAIKKLLADQNRREIIQQSVERMTEALSFDTMAVNLVKLYQNVIRQSTTMA